MDFRWIPCGISPCGFHVDSIWIPYGFHVSKYMIYVVKHIPCGFHVDSMDSTWNKSVPHGFHVECGGMVKYCLFDLTTIYRFDKRFPGPAIMIQYFARRSPDDTSDSGKSVNAHGILSDPLKVLTYNLEDLPLVEKQAVKSGG